VFCNPLKRKENAMFSKYAFRVIILLSVAFFFRHLNARDTTNFFPHHLNNLWEYYDITFFSEIDTVQIKVVFDSTDSAGNHYVSMDEYFINPLTHRIYHHYIIDTSGNIYSTTGLFTYPALIYKADAQQGDIWVAFDFGGGYGIAKLKKVYTDSLFGFSSTFKEIWYYNTSDTSDTTLWLLQYADILAGGLGRVFRGGGEAISDQYLKGAVIDGVTYGDITQISSIDHPGQPVIADQVILFPNYPNPFNPLTTIRFTLPRANPVSLIVYDINGKEVMPLLAGKTLPPGEHRIFWEGKNRNGLPVSSGIYFYQLKAGNFNQVRKMMLLK